MKLEAKFFGRTSLLALFSLSVSLSTHGATTNAATSKTAPTNKSAPAATSENKTEAALVQSVFEIPQTPTAGKDPFFPKSSRVYAAFQVAQPTKTNQPVVVVMELVLSGISGSAEQPLAIINDRTFAPGESREVASGGQNKTIRCLEINMQAKTALVELPGGERRELRLKPTR